jgi:hypothetical protein
MGDTFSMGCRRKATEAPNLPDATSLQPKSARTYRLALDQFAFAQIAAELKR